MSVNHFSQDLPETLWWANSQNHHHLHLLHHHQQQSFMDIPSSSPSKPHHDQFSAASWSFHHGHHTTATLNFNLNREDDDDLDEQVIDGGGGGIGGHSHGEERRVPSELDKEVLFEKPLTPSDVGKLNRLVIPKQHAEKYFPLGADSVDKGLLLNFEDESGKFWRFRYSYWSSSQSYVLTKGWSRYVKEKRLDAGDVVFFERHRTNGERIFIGWRRRGTAAAAAAQEGGHGGGASGADGWGRRRAVYPDSEHHHHHHQQHHHHPNFAYPTHQGDDGPPVPYRPDCTHAGSDGQRPGNSRGLLRLFGVNMEYQVDEPETSTSEGSSLSPSHHRPSQHHQYLF